MTQYDPDIRRSVEKFLATRSHDYSTENKELVAKADECVQVDFCFVTIILLNIDISFN